MRHLLFFICLLFTSILFKGTYVAKGEVGFNRQYCFFFIDSDKVRILESLEQKEKSNLQSDEETQEDREQQGLPIFQIEYMYARRAKTRNMSSRRRYARFQEYGPLILSA